MRPAWLFLVLGACATHDPAPPSLAAADDELTVEMDTPAEVDVLGNDVGVDDGRVLEILAAPSHGTAVFGDRDVLRYEPAAAYLGDDEVTYRITNPDGDVATARIAIRVGCATCAVGVAITLAWDPNPPEQMVTGYRAYLGSSEDPTTMQMVDDIATTQAGFDPAAPSVTYDGWTDLHLRIGDRACFAMTAYNGAGESGFSNPACKTVTKTSMSFGL